MIEVFPPRNCSNSKLTIIVVCGVSGMFPEGSSCEKFNSAKRKQSFKRTNSGVTERGKTLSLTYDVVEESCH